MLTEPRLDRGEAGECPKAPWVMLTFSDDEAFPSQDAMPAGLRFHLSRCPTCRAIADRLSAASSALEHVKSNEPLAGLTERAVSRAEASLRSEARLTGRVAVNEAGFLDIETEWGDEPDSMKEAMFSGLRGVAALAACIGLTLGLVASWRLVGRSLTPPVEPGSPLTVQASPYVSKDSNVGSRHRNPPLLPVSESAVGPFNVEADSIYADPIIQTPEDQVAASSEREMTARVAPHKIKGHESEPTLPERILDSPASAVSTGRPTKDRQ